MYDEVIHDNKVFRMFFDIEIKQLGNVYDGEMFKRAFKDAEAKDVLYEQLLNIFEEHEEMISQDDLNHFQDN